MRKSAKSQITDVALIPVGQDVQVTVVSTAMVIRSKLPKWLGGKPMTGLYVKRKKFWDKNSLEFGHEGEFTIKLALEMAYIMAVTRGFDLRPVMWNGERWEQELATAATAVINVNYPNEKDVLTQHSWHVSDALLERVIKVFLEGDFLHRDRKIPKRLKRGLRF